jgi:hypothetical protein
MTEENHGEKTRTVRQLENLVDSIEWRLSKKIQALEKVAEELQDEIEKMSKDRAYQPIFYYTPYIGEDNDND